MKKIKINKLKLRKIITIVIAVILLFSVYLNSYLLIKYNVLPTKYFIIYSLFCCLIPILLIFFTVFIRMKRYIKNILLGIEIFFIIILFIVFFYLNQTFNFLDSFTSNFDYETKTYYVLVAPDSNYKKIEELENKEIGYASNLDKNIDKGNWQNNNK